MMPETAVIPRNESAAESKQSALSLTKAVWIILKKDLKIEWQGRARTNATAFFCILTLMLFSFAMGAQSRILTEGGGGFYWLILVLASLMNLGESMRIEEETEALEGLRLIPVPPLAIFLGKALANTAYLFVLGLFVLPLAIAVFDLSLTLGIHYLLGILLLGSAAISAPGTLHATMAIQARARDTLLPLLLFPVIIPPLISATKATSLILTGDPMEQLYPWTLVLIGSALLYWVVCSLLYAHVIEE